MLLFYSIHVRNLTSSSRLSREDWGKLNYNELCANVFHCFPVYRREEIILIKYNFLIIIIVYIYIYTT